MKLTEKNIEEKVKKKMEWEMPLRIILDMRFGDGTGEKNLAIEMAVKEITNLHDMKTLREKNEMRNM